LGGQIVSSDQQICCHVPPNLGEQSNYALDIAMSLKQRAKDENFLSAAELLANDFEG
jgi:hypothetical protein